MHSLNALFTGGLKHLKMEMRALKDDPCLGCPCEAVIPRKIAKVEELVNDNPHITIKMIEKEVGISKEIIESILHMYLSFTSSSTFAIFLGMTALLSGGHLSMLSSPSLNVSTHQ